MYLKKIKPAITRIRMIWLYLKKGY